jgi:hypothetical protein
MLKKPIKIQLLYQLLDQICSEYETEYYTVDYSAFKKMQYYQLDEPFRNDVYQYYNEKYLHYIREPFTFKTFNKVLLHVFNSNKIPYTYVRKYHEGDIIQVYTISRWGTNGRLTS